MKQAIRQQIAADLVLEPGPKTQGDATGRHRKMG